MINKLAKEIHENALSKGFYKGEVNTAEKLALIHSEVSEALEADREDRHSSKGNISFIIKEKSEGLFRALYRQDHKNTIEEELADTIIRTLDFAAYKEIDIESHILAKMRFNKGRTYMHGKRY